MIVLNTQADYAGFKTLVAKLTSPIVCNYPSVPGMQLGFIALMFAFAPQQQIVILCTTDTLPVTFATDFPSAITLSSGWLTSLT